MPGKKNISLDYFLCFQWVVTQDPGSARLAGFDMRNRPHSLREITLTVQKKGGAEAPPFRGIEKG